MSILREIKALPFRSALVAGLLMGLGCAATPPPAPPAEAAAPRAAEPPESAEATEVHTNTIKWATASEVDNFGFDVFRSESEDGPFDRINSEVIEGAGTIDEPQQYQFVDDTIDPRTTYYYYVESISMAGVRERFTPVGKAKPKIPPEDDEPAAAPEAGDDGG